MKYLIELFSSDEDEAWVAVVPDLPGCSAVGATPESAAAEVQDAIEASITACRAAGDPAPEPSSKARQAAGESH
jgi:predicted RNase H-like HicB family nuclease